MFQRRHYKEIAKILNDCKEWAEMDEYIFHGILSTFAVAFEKDNPNFNTQRFMAAANGDE